jgi:hypothetical protein
MVHEPQHRSIANIYDTPLSVDDKLQSHSKLPQGKHEEIRNIQILSTSDRNLVDSLKVMSL